MSDSEEFIEKPTESQLQLKKALDEFEKVKHLFEPYGKDSPVRATPKLDAHIDYLDPWNKMFKLQDDKMLLLETLKEIRDILRERK